MALGANKIFETGIPNLDLLLGGGIPRRQTLIVTGSPGGGKTILVNQIAFLAAAQGLPVVFSIFCASSRSTPASTTSLGHTRASGRNSLCLECPRLTVVSWHSLSSVACITTTGGWRDTHGVVWIEKVASTAAQVAGTRVDDGGAGSQITACLGRAAKQNRTLGCGPLRRHDFFPAWTQSDLRRCERCTPLRRPSLDFQSVGSRRLLRVLDHLPPLAW